VDGLPGRNSSGYEGLLDPVQLAKLALKGGNARGALRHGYRIVRHALHAYSTHVTVPEQLVAVQILLTPFQDPDRCDTMCLPGLDPTYETSRVHRIDGRLAAVAAGVCAYVAAFR